MLRMLQTVNKSTKGLDEIKRVISGFAKTSLKLEKFKIAQITRDFRGTLKIGPKTMSETIHLLKSGRFEEVIPLMFGVQKIPPHMITKLTNEFKHLPHFKITRNRIKVQKMKRLMKIEKDLEKFNKSTAKITEENVRANSKMMRVMEFMKNKTFKSLTFGTTFVAGLSLSATVAFINKHKQNMTGCIRHENINGEMVSCNLSSRTCNNGRLGDVVADGGFACKSDVDNSGLIKFEDDADVDAHLMFCKNSEDGTCYRCEMLNYDSETNESVYYTCEQPSFIDALGDITNDKLESLGEFITEKGHALNSIIDIVLKSLKYVAIVSGGLIVLYIIFYAISKYRQIEKIDYT